MRIYIDIDSHLVYSTPLQRSASIQLKRRDLFQFEVVFLRDTVPHPLPNGVNVRFAIKKNNDFTGEFLTHSFLSSVDSNSDGESAVFGGVLSLNTVEIEASFAQEPSSVDAMFEVEWSYSDTDNVNSSMPVSCTLFNDVIRGNEGTPASLPIFYTSETSDFLASQTEAEQGTENSKWMSPLRTAEAIAALSVKSYNDLTEVPTVFPPESHTHSFSDLTQSSATTGQVPTWNGTAWVPQTPATGSGGGGVSSYSDLTDVPTEFPPEAHTHTATDITSGTLAIARIPTGTTSTTVCLGNDSRLSDARTPTAHTHGNISSAGAIGSTSGVPIITGSSGVLQAGSFGTTAGTFAAGNHTHSNYLTTSGGITAIAVVTTMPAAPDPNTLYIVTA